MRIHAGNAAISIVPASLAGALALLCAACASQGGPATAGNAAPAAAGPASPVEALLDLSQVESIVGGRAPAFTRQVALLAGDLTDAELGRLVPAVTAAFAPELLRADIASFLAEEAPAGTIDTLLAWHRDGATAELLRLSRSYTPPRTLDEYARALTTDPPPEERVRGMVEWVEAQGAGDFFVLLEESLTQAAHTVLAELRPGSPSFRPLAGEPLFSQLDASFNAAVATFLRSLEPVPDDVIRRATAEYASEAGRWYVENYSLAVAEAMRAAGSRAAHTLSGAAGGTGRRGDSSRARGAARADGVSRRR